MPLELKDDFYVSRIRYVPSVKEWQWMVYKFGAMVAHSKGWATSKIAAEHLVEEATIQAYCGLMA